MEIAPLPVENIRLIECRRLCEEMGLEEPMNCLERESSVRARILESALTYFGRFGYEATSIDLLVEQSGTSPSTLYRQFGSKQELLNYLFKILHEEYFDYFKGMNRCGDFCAEHFYRLFRQRIGYGLYRPMRHEFIRERDHRLYLSEENIRMLDESRVGAVRMFEKAQAARCIRAGDPEVLLGILRGCVNNSMKLIYENRVALTVENMELLLKCMWDAVRY